MVNTLNDLDGNICLKDKEAIRVFGKDYFDNSNFECECEPSDLKNEISELSDTTGVEDDVFYDLLTPVFTSDGLSDYFDNDEFIVLSDLESDENEEDNNFECGDNVSEEDNEKLEEFEDKISELEDELQVKDEEIQEYKEKVEKYKEKEKERLIDNIVSVKESKNVYSDDDEIEEDRKEFKEMSTDSLEQLLKMVEKMPEPSADTPTSQVTETEEDFDNNSPEKELEKKMFGDNKVYKD